MALIGRAWKQLKIIAEMIKIEHTIFALPFAFMGAILAAEGLPSLHACLWVLVAMVGGRSAAMAFNRIADAGIDAKNPRTSMRALPAGLLKKSEVILFTFAASALFIFAAWMLNPLAFYLSFPVLLILLGYSYTKRFTWASHFVLGFCLGMTPLAGWIAVKGTIELLPALLTAGVLFWTAGFDIIYSCQDYEVDREEGLFSIPSRFGIKNALILSAVLHLLTMAFFSAAGVAAGLSWPYWTAAALTFASLTYQHLIVKPTDLSRVNMAFFTANGFVSIVMAVGTYLAVVI